jgi:enoyl-CoA hydratase
MKYEHILVERDGPIGIITLNRPEVRNAISTPLLAEIVGALESASALSVRVFVITGGSSVFSAGADVGELQQITLANIYLTDYPGGRAGLWRRFGAVREPILAAVAGYALGGGCELALACDLILAADNAKFGQPEINIGTMPGAGGTQRLARIAGKAKAMDLCLTGRIMDASEAERCGVVSRVVAASELAVEALKTAKLIASKATASSLMIKEAINIAYESTLAQGIVFERRAFQTTFAMPAIGEGISAFLEKRKPAFHRDEP